MDPEIWTACLAVERSSGHHLTISLKEQVTCLSVLHILVLLHTHFTSGGADSCELAESDVFRAVKTLQRAGHGVLQGTC